MADFPSDKYTFDCKYVQFCIELNTFIRLGMANAFLFLIPLCCYFYVKSQSTFPDQIRPRPLIACLNCAACRYILFFLIKNWSWTNHENRLLKSISTFSIVHWNWLFVGRLTKPDMRQSKIIIHWSTERTLFRKQALWIIKHSMEWISHDLNCSLQKCIKYDWIQRYFNFSCIHYTKETR